MYTREKYCSLCYCRMAWHSLILSLYLSFSLSTIIIYLLLNYLIKMLKCTCTQFPMYNSERFFLAKIFAQSTANNRILIHLWCGKLIAFCLCFKKFLVVELLSRCSCIHTYMCFLGWQLINIFITITDITTWL